MRRGGELTAAEKKMPPRGVTRSGGESPGRMPPMGFDWRASALMSFDLYSHFACALRLASIRHRLPPPFAAYQKEGKATSNDSIPNFSAAVNICNR